MPSTKNSTKFCIPVGFNCILLVAIKKKTAIIIVPIHAVNIEFVKFNGPICANVSALSEVGGFSTGRNILATAKTTATRMKGNAFFISVIKTPFY